MRVLLIVGVLAALAVLVVMLLPKRTLEQQASDLVQALLAGDTDVLWERSVEKLRGDSGLTKETYARLYRELVAPRMIGWRPAGPADSVSDGSEAYGSHGVVMRHANGREFVLAWNAFDSGEGAGLICATEILPKAWVMDYLASGEDLSVSGSISLAKYLGLKADLLKLRQIGLKGSVPLDASQPIKPLDAWLADLAERSKHLRPASN